MIESGNAARTTTRRERIAGLDSLRFVLASWVAIGHIWLYTPAALQNGTGTLAIVRGVYNNIFSGAAAVIAFFVISGFCIHYGLGGTSSINLQSYFVRRWTRTLIPLGAALVVNAIIGYPYDRFGPAILWSLVCEEIYYVLYPVLLRIRTHFEWRRIIEVSFVLAFLVAATQPKVGNYPSFGSGLNWLLGLPCWLLGCELAEQVMRGNFRVVSTGEMWRWRMGVWFVSAVLSVLRFHAGIGYPWTLNLFALLVYGWLAREIGYYRTRKPADLLERAGLWSYSLYLMHLGLADQVRGWLAFGFIGWLGRYALVFPGCYVFYLLVERPAHIGARHVSRLMAQRTEVRRERA